MKYHFKISNLIFRVFILLFIVVGCKKENSSQNGRDNNGQNANNQSDTISGPNTMSEVAAEELDNLDIPNYRLNTSNYNINHLQLSIKTHKASSESVVVDQNYSLNELLQAMIKDADVLSSKQMKHDAVLDQNINGHIIHSPEHYGYAYSYGQSILSERLLPVLGNNLHRSYSVFGVDCSGFINLLFKNQGLALLGRFDVSEFQDVLDKSLSSDPKFSNFKLIRIDNILYTSLLDGDFVVWDFIADYKQRIHHMGMFHKDKNGGVLYNSHGTGLPSKVSDQEKNYGAKRGIHVVSMDDAVNHVKQTGQNKGKLSYFGCNFYVIRLVSKNILPVLSTAKQVI